MSNNQGNGREILYNLPHKSRVKMQIQQKLRAKCQVPEAVGINRDGRMGKGWWSVSANVKLNRSNTLWRLLSVVTNGGENTMHNSEIKVGILFSPYRGEKYLRWQMQLPCWSPHSAYWNITGYPQKEMLLVFYVPMKSKFNRRNNENLKCIS